MGEMKPTPGPWEAKPTGPWDGWDGWSVEDADGSVVCDAHGSQFDGRREANARLIAEAGTVFHNTGLSPVQLVEMVKELKAALGGITAMCEQHGDFRNGVTDPTGTIDEGDVVAGRVIGSARAALAKCEGVK